MQDRYYTIFNFQFASFIAQQLTELFGEVSSQD